ncbi:MAG TPA: hypothetical protein VIM58_06620 [Candidatus Methylacidiphilales bacterium]
MRTLLLPLLFLPLLLAAPLRAQDTATPTQAKWLWAGNFPGGTVKVRLQQILSVSTSRYTVEGGFRVTELVIDTTGNNSIRIYAVESPLDAAGPSGMVKTGIGALQDKVQAAADHAAAVTGGGSALSDLTSTTVMKKYPEATHAHTIEYRLPTVKEVADVYRSIDSAWETGQGGTYNSSAGTSIP